MQNYEQILQELGIEVPDDKKNALKQKMRENYRTKADYDKAIEKRDEYKESLDDVQEKLDGFKDVDVDDLKGQISTLTKQLNDEKEERAKDAARVELDKNVNTFLSDKKFVNALTEKSIRASLMEELEKDTAKGKSIEDIFKGLISDKEGNQMENILISEEQQRANQNAARFTEPMKRKPGPGKTYSMAELMKMKNDNPGLDITQYMK